MHGRATQVHLQTAETYVHSEVHPLTRRPLGTQHLELHQCRLLHQASGRNNGSVVSRLNGYNQSCVIFSGVFWDRYSNIFLRFFGTINSESADWKILENLEYGAWHVPCPAWLVLQISPNESNCNGNPASPAGVWTVAWQWFFCVGVLEPFSILSKCVKSITWHW